MYVIIFFLGQSRNETNAVYFLQFRSNMLFSFLFKHLSNNHLQSLDIKHLGFQSSTVNTINTLEVQGPVVNVKV